MLLLRSGFGHDKSQAILPYRKLIEPPTLFFFGDGVSGTFFPHFALVLTDRRVSNLRHLSCKVCGYAFRENKTGRGKRPCGILPKGAHQARLIFRFLERSANRPIRRPRRENDRRVYQYHTLKLSVR